MVTVRPKGLRVATGAAKGRGAGRLAASSPGAGAGKARLYPAEDAPAGRVARAQRGHVVRKSLAPGAVAILLAGRFKGKRVVVLKHLPSGLLLVSGPRALNGVPLRRVNPAYVIATETRVSVSGVSCSLEDKDFKAAKPVRESRGEGDFMKDAPQKKEVPAAFKQAQEAVDAALLKEIKKVPELEGYMRSLFTLRSGMRPHLMKF